MAELENLDAADEVDVQGSESSKEQDISANGNPNLSKRQLRRLLKKQRWEQFKGEKRKKEKERKKQRRREKIDRGEEVGPSRKRLKRRRMHDSECKVQVAIDCSFDDLMSDRDISKLVRQIQHSYSVNRRAANPVQLYVTSIGGKMKKLMDSIGDYKHWDINKRSQDYMSVFTKDEVVYLSSESPNMLSSLDPNKVYILGGLVDHNHHKGLCHRLAEEKGIQHGQLPIGQYLEMKSRRVLTIDHVFEILLRYTEMNDWEQSFLKVLPQRKGAVSKKQGQDSSDAASDSKGQVASASRTEGETDEDEDEYSSADDDDDVKKGNDVLFDNSGDDNDAVVTDDKINVEDSEATPEKTDSDSIKDNKRTSSENC